MTVKEMFYQKYLHELKTMNKVTWENYKYYAKAKKMHIAQYMYMCIEITVNDIRANGGFTGELWKEISSMHKDKLIASNEHRQASGQVTKYWLTKKGFKELNKNGEIC